MKPTIQVIHELDHSMPAAADAQLGRLLNDIVNTVNAVIADNAARDTAYKALLGHMDTANVAGLGNANAADFSPTAPTATDLVALGQRS